jgi:lipopolysaccharide transport system ATP-binding protein
MQARLGFAIAAHLDPDVLIIDEALGVGDEAFQRKAFARVQELVRRETPVVVVSHQLEAVASLCTRGLYLERGRVARQGTPRECIDAYLEGVAVRDAAAPGDAAVRIESVRVEPEAVRSGGRTRVVARCTVREGGWPASESVVVRVRSARTGEVAFETSTLRLGLPLPEGGTFAVEAELQANVPAGVYAVETLVWDRIMERQSFAGPRASLEVGGGEEFDGPVQMNPRLRVTALPDDTSSAAPAAPTGAGEAP